MIDKNVKLGKNVKIFDPKLVNIFGCEIGDHTFIGPFVEITRGVVIGKNCIIESHTFICDGVTIKNNVFIGHGVTFTNDPYPRIGINSKYLKTLVREGVSIGSGATILPGLTIGQYTLIGAGAVVTKSVPDFSVAYGNPVKVKKKFKSRSQIENYIKNRLF